MSGIHKVLAIDPGATCGYAIWQHGLKKADQVPVSQMMHWLQHNIGAFDACVCEDFTIMPSTLKKAADAKATIKVLGFVEWSARLAGTSFTSYQASQAKTFMTDDKLQTLGWYEATRGGHRNDACRHLGLFLFNAKVLKPSDLLPLREALMKDA